MEIKFVLSENSHRINIGRKRHRQVYYQKDVMKFIEELRTAFICESDLMPDEVNKIINELVGEFKIEKSKGTRGKDE